jgi:hypothetical protein
MKSAGIREIYSFDSGFRDETIKVLEKPVR